MFRRLSLQTICVISILVLMPLSTRAEELIPDFNLKNLKGENVTLSEFRGKENVLLVFGATWCFYCTTEIPELNELYDEFDGQGLKILNIDIGEPRRRVLKYSKKKGIKYEILLDEEGTVAQNYGVYGIPMNFFIDKNGKIQMAGQLDVERIRELMS